MSHSQYCPETGGMQRTGLAEVGAIKFRPPRLTAAE